MDTRQENTPEKSENPSNGENANQASAAAPVPPKELEQRGQAGQGPDRRQSVVDRRAGLDRRQKSREESGYTGPERRVANRREDTGLERRRGPGRRRSDDRKAAEEGEMTNEQFEFCMAIETYKKVNKKMFPTWTEVLEVMQQLGYRKVMQRNISLENCPEPELYRIGEKKEDPLCDGEYSAVATGKAADERRHQVGQYPRVGRIHAIGGHRFGRGKQQCRRRKNLRSDARHQCSPGKS